MSKRIGRWPALFVALMLLPVFSAAAADENQPPYRLQKEDLLKIMGQQDLLVLDVRASEHWRHSDTMIRGAARQAPERFDFWSADLPHDKKLVLYCD